MGASFAVSGLVSLKETTRRVTLQLRQQTRGQTGLNLKRNVFPWFSPTSENLHFLAYLSKMGQGEGNKVTRGWQRAVVGEAKLSCLRNLAS